MDDDLQRRWRQMTARPRPNFDMIDHGPRVSNFLFFLVECLETPTGISLLFFLFF